MTGADAYAALLMRPAHRQRYQQYYLAKGLGIPQTPHAWQGAVDQVMAALGANAWTVLDYGCGPEARLSRFAAYVVANYDPAVPMFAALPDVADLVVCWHVLEHVEPDCLTHVLDHIRTVARQAILVAVSCQPSTKALLDGTPWHTIVQPPPWWAHRLRQAWGNVLSDQLHFPPRATEYHACFLVHQECR